MSGAVTGRGTIVNQLKDTHWSSFGRSAGSRGRRIPRQSFQRQSHPRSCCPCAGDAAIAEDVAMAVDCSAVAVVVAAGPPSAAGHTGEQVGQKPRRFVRGSV